jgi:four helix bundle protein
MDVLRQVRSQKCEVRSEYADKDETGERSPVFVFLEGQMDDLKERSRDFAIQVVKFTTKLPKTTEYQIIGKQLMRCALSVGANYRAARRAKSKLDFISKIATVEEESDEVCYWLEIIECLGFTDVGDLLRLKDEAGQLLRIFTASRKTAKGLSKQFLS